MKVDREANRLPWMGGKANRLLGLFLALSLILAACSSDGQAGTTEAPGDTTTDGETSTTAEGTTDGETGGPSGSVTLVLDTEPDTLATWTSFRNVAYPVLRNVQEALINRDPVTNELVPELAVSWEQVDDVTWRFDLREGVKFHDGTDFNAEAAAFSLNHTWGPENEFVIRQYMGPEFVASAVDEFTLEIVTEEPDPILPIRLYFSSISSMDQIQNDPEGYETAPIGTGPYKFVEWQRGQWIKIEANPDWWGLSSDDAYGEVTIAEATFLYREEAEVRAAMVQTGEADLARWLTPEQCDALENPCVEGPGVETLMLRIDTPNPTLGDKRIRHAVAYAIDKETIMNDIAGGGPVASMIAGPAATGYAESLEPFPYDLEKAAELVAEAAADGVDVEIPLVVETSTGWINRSDEMIQIITDAMQSIGLTGTTSMSIEHGASTEMFIVPRDEIPPDRGMLALWQHSNELMDYSASIAGYYTCESPISTFCDPAVDEQIAEAGGLSGEERDAALQEIAAILLEEMAIVPIGHPNVRYGMADRLDWEHRLDGFILLKEMTLND